MTVRLSPGLADFLAQDGSAKQFFAGAIIQIYDGSQPSSADLPPNGSLINTITLASGTHTPETLATGSVTLTGGASGNVSSITVNGIEILGATVGFVSDLYATATAVATQINTFSPFWSATTTGYSGVITLIAPVGSGASFNGKTVACTSSTITTSTATPSGGVAAVNGISFGISSGGVMSKSGVWSGVATASSTPSSFRIVRSAADATGTSSTALRLDGAISSSGAELNISPNISAVGVTQTVDTFYVTEPMHV
jgi:hypothetical protein